MLNRLALPIGSLFPQPAIALTTSMLAGLAIAASWRGATLRTASMVHSLALATLLLAAIVVAYYYPIHVRHQTKTYLYTVAYFLLAVLVPPSLAAVCAGLGALAGEVARRRSSGAYVSDIATESARRVLMVLPASLLVHDGYRLAPQPLLLVGAALLLLILDIVSFPLVLSPISGEPPLRTAATTAQATIVSEVAQYALALVGAVAALHNAWVLPALIVPCALLHAAFKILLEMQEGTRQLLENMADAVDLRDPYTGGHSRRVAEYSARILQALGYHGQEVDLILAAARVHDIGKIGVPDAILHKPGPLTDEERRLMEQHPVQGEALLTRYPDFARGRQIVRHHHERWDGMGYPDGIAETAIPFGARVIAVADSFDAMTSDRPYRAGLATEKALDILRQGRGTQWDGPVVDALLLSVAGQAHGGAPPVLASTPA